MHEWLEKINIVLNCLITSYRKMFESVILLICIYLDLNDCIIIETLQKDEWSTLNNIVYEQKSKKS